MRRKEQHHFLIATFLTKSAKNRKSLSLTFLVICYLWLLLKDHFPLGFAFAFAFRQLLVLHGIARFRLEASQTRRIVNAQSQRPSFFLRGT